jgi:hypothetical protein
MLSTAGTEAAARCAKRVKVFQPATLVHAGSTLRIHLLDVSERGALAHAQEPAAAGARVRIECEGVVREASVQWREGRRFGLAFDRPLLPQQVSMLATPKRNALQASLPSALRSR